MKNKQHPSDVEFYRIRRKLNKILLPMTWPERMAYIHEEAKKAIPNPLYSTPERRAERDAYVKRVAAEYRAQKAAKKAAEAALAFGEDPAKYNTQTP